MKKRLLLSITLFINCILFSQTGPAGVGSSTNNVLWLKANAGVYNNAGTTLASNGDNVQQWNDYSGNSDHASQTTAANRPNYVTNSINGNPVIRYTAGNADLLMSTTVGTGNAASIWAVASYSSLPSSNPGVLVAAPAGSGTSVAPGNKTIGIWVSNAAGTRVWGRGIQSNSTSLDISQVTTLNTNTRYIINNMYNGSTSINQFINNNAAGNVAYNGTLSSWSDVTIGRQGTETWNGDIAEVIMYNTFVNSAQKNIIDNYLSAKYNIALSTNNKYIGDDTLRGNYDFDVAGVGMEASGSNTEFAASVSKGIRLLVNSGLESGDYILAGHASATNAEIASDVVGMTGTNNARWQRIWYLDITNTSTVINTNIEFDMSDGGVPVVLGTTTNYVLLYRAGQTGNWTELAIANSTPGDRVKFNGIDLTNDGYYTIGTKDFTVSPLPIELLNFNAIAKNKKVELTWSTATEINNDFFTIEKTKDGINFETLSIVDGGGNSTIIIDYFDTDNYPFDGISYYRLKQTDFNGNYTYSQIVPVNYYFGDDGISIFPNPSNSDESITIDFTGLKDQTVLVVVRDIHGKEFYSKVNVVSENKQLVAVDLENRLAAGVYIVIASSSNKIYSQKLIVK
jgi:hypothetical protein